MNHKHKKIKIKYYFLHIKYAMKKKILLNLKNRYKSRIVFKRFPLFLKGKSGIKSYYGEIPSTS